MLILYIRNYNANKHSCNIANYSYIYSICYNNYIYYSVHVYTHITITCELNIMATMPIVQPYGYVLHDKHRCSMLHNHDPV